MDRLNKILVVAVITVIVAAIAVVAVWQYQRRTLSWDPVPITIVSSEIHHSEREQSRGMIWTATITYSVDGVGYSTSIDNLPLSADQVYVDPQDPTRIVGRRGPTGRALFIPVLALVLSGLFAVVVVLMKISPQD